MSLTIYNTLSRKKEGFEPIEPGKIKMYVCGMTTYDLCHLGHARACVAFDVVQRYLRFTGYDVKYIRNITDVDDKIIQRANERDVSPEDLANQYIDEFYKDMESLDVQLADVEPRVSTHIQEIIQLIVRILEQGHAYAIDGDVYFDIQSFEPYGVLSRRTVEELQAGARVEVDSRKKNPADFALWKSVKPGEPSWDSPWGHGRPGWHIECSAMSCTHLGDEFDIHGGGVDLVFPHHENEIAQSHGASGNPPVRYWMHNGHVNVDDEKMSKSLKNFFTIREVLDIHHPQAIRLFLLSTHYRSPINYSLQTLEDAERRLAYLYDTLLGIDAALAEGIDTESGDLLEADRVQHIMTLFGEAMNDDFNSPLALGHLSDVAKLANDLIRRKKKTPGRGKTLQAIRDALSAIGNVLGVMNKDPRETLAALRVLAIKRLGIDEARIDQLVVERTAARNARDWERADLLRDQLVDEGIELMDGPEGTTWRPTFANPA